MKRRRHFGLLAALRGASPRRWLALWLVLINVVGAPLAPAPVMADVPATLDGQPYVICALGGPIVPGQPGDPAQPGQPAQYCVFCLPLLHGVAAAAVPPPLPVPSDRVAFVPLPLPTVATIPARRVVAANGARAPPG